MLRRLRALVSRLRGLLALWAGKAVIRASRLTGRGGSTFPGRVARRLDPLLLPRLAGQCRLGTVVVTGTNGKTTTTRMMAGIFGRSGLDLVHNRSGANLIVGVTASYLEKSSLTGYLRADIGLSEVDEATVPWAVREVRPRVAVVTNFFRDQLDRYGELEHTVDLVRQGLALMTPPGYLVLNADDPLVAFLGEGLPGEVIHYGLELDREAGGDIYQVADIKNCHQCGWSYRYELSYYAHLGRYSCPRCDRRRPRPQVYVDELVTDGTKGTRCHVVTPAGDFRVYLPIPGLFNVYNALAAAGGALAMGASLSAVEDGLASAAASFGRMEAISINGRRVFLALVKNPAGFNQVIRMLLDEEGPLNLLIAINDLLADGTDVSWLWDVDFEKLARNGADIPFVISAGIRAEDMALRLKYAGFDLGRLLLEKDLGGAIRKGLELTRPGGTLYVLPTYTAMLGARRVINDMGYARRFWEA